jgi:adenosylcobinamide-phosphate synthase
MADAVIGLRPSAELLAVAMLLDVTIGDPDYAWHPVRAMGHTLSASERTLRRCSLDGYGGGILLCLFLTGVWISGISAAVLFAASLNAWLGAAAHLFVLYSLVALGSLLDHGRRIETALRSGDLHGARTAVSRLVGRDTRRMDAAACRRAAVESLSENLTDAVVSPLLWYALGGLPMLVAFKIVSTMDSMVGYRTLEYLRFGWCGARLDDAMNYVPARLTWLIVSASAAVLPGCSGSKALRYGRLHHAVLPSPNSGWSEAAIAGALERRLVGPIWRDAALVTDTWIGADSDPLLGTAADYDRAARLVAVCGAVAAAFSAATAFAW